MPYGNFDDNYATQLLYNQQQQEDPDLTLTEFIFGKLLYIGDLIQEDADAIPAKTPLDSRQPYQGLQIQAGFLEFSKPFLRIQPAVVKTTRLFCRFKDNKFDRKFPSAVFRPPVA